MWFLKRGLQFLTKVPAVIISHSTGLHGPCDYGLSDNYAGLVGPHEPELITYKMKKSLNNFFINIQMVNPITLQMINYATDQQDQIDTIDARAQEQNIKT